MVFEEYFQYYNEYEPQFNNVVVFMEMGMFMSCYEFEGVGKTHEVGKLLNLTITQPYIRKTESKQNPYMIGFPKNAKSKYLPILLKNNYSVVWVEQDHVTKDNHQSPITRKKTRVYTPGTLFEDPLTSEEYNICCIHSIDKDTHYATVIDTSIGKVEFVSLSETKNLNWFCCVYKPYELLCLCDEKMYSQIKCFFKNTKAIYLKSVEDNIQCFNKIYQKTIVHSVYSRMASLQDIQTTYLPSFVCLINFIKVCHFESINMLSYPTEQYNNYMSLHNNAAHQLDVIETSKGGGLFNIVNKTSTMMGCRLLRKQLLKPMTLKNDIELMYAAVEKMIPHTFKIDDMLKGIPDIDRKIKNIYVGNFTLQEVVGLSNMFKNTVYLYEYDNHILVCIQEIEKFVNSHINMDNVCFTYPIELVNLKRNLDEKINELETYVKQLTNGMDFECKLDLQSLTISTTSIRALRLKKALIKKNKKSSVELTNNIIEQLFHDYQYTKDLFDQMNKQILQSFLKLWYINCSNYMKYISEVVANVDVVKARAICAIEYNYKKPIVSDNPISFVCGKNIRHPIIESQDNVKYVANDVILDKGMLLYGINGSGKSSYGRAVALNIILAQSGFFVPAESFEFAPYESIFTRIGSDDNMYQAMSSFWLEVTEMNSIVRCGNHKSLVIGDELFKGTEDLSAISLVSACLHWMSTKNISYIFATHLHKLPEVTLVKNLDLRIMHMKSEYCKISKTIIFNRSWCDGKGDPNYGIEVAEYILDDPTIIHNAKIVRHELLNTNPVVQFKKSRYNGQIIMDKCAHCNNVNNLHTHHIQPQKEIINNKSVNLLTLCENCHHKIHSNKLTHKVLDSVVGNQHMFT
jgi:DNA mismatch repair protein MutS